MNKIIQTNVTNIGDPFIVLENDFYYMFATSPDNNLFRVWRSKDKEHFEEIGIALENKNSFGSCSFWAPEVYKYNNEFYMFYSARDNTGIMHIQVAKSSCITGPYKDIDIEHPLLYLKDKSTIDAHVYFGKDKNVLFFSMDCSTNIINGVHISQLYAIELSKDLTHTIGKMKFISTPTSPWEILPTYEWAWNEGPYVLEHNGKFYLTYSTNCYACRDYMVGCYIANDIMGPYQHMVDEPILRWIDGEISGPGHNMFFTDKDGSLWCSFHIHVDYDNPSDKRKACLCKAHFENDLLVIDYK